MVQEETERTRFLNRLLRDQEASNLEDVTVYLRQFDSISGFVREEYAALIESGAVNSRADLARYEELRELGRGGMGLVRLARDRMLDREVVLKTLRVGYETPSGLVRLRREAHALGQLDHPDLCPILDVLGHGDQFTLVLPYLGGETFATYIESAASADPRPPWVVLPGGDDQPPLARLLTWMARVADAVDAVHRAGFVHRDLKPANLLVRENGSPAVIDFGLALASSGDDQRLTLTGDSIGTPLYMAPEQVEGRVCDARTDVYALGVLLYEALTLERPFEGETRQATFGKILASQPEPLRSRNPRVSRDLEAVCHKAMSRDPARRYAAAGELADELRRVVRLEPTAARPESGIRRALRLVQRRPGRAAAVVVGVVGATLAVGYTIEQVRVAAAAERRDQHLARARDAYEKTKHDYAGEKDGRADTVRSKLEALLAATTPEDLVGLYYRIDIAHEFLVELSDPDRADRLLTDTIERLPGVRWSEADRKRVLRLGVPLARRHAAGTPDDLLGWALEQRGMARGRLGRRDKARSDLIEAERVLIATGNFHRQANAVHDLAELEVHFGDPANAARLLDRAAAMYAEANFGDEWTEAEGENKRVDSNGIVAVGLLRGHLQRREGEYRASAENYLRFLQRWAYPADPDHGVGKDPFAASPKTISPTNHDFTHAALWHAESLLMDEATMAAAARGLDFVREHGDATNLGVGCHLRYVEVLREWRHSGDARTALRSADQLEYIWESQRQYPAQYFDLDWFRAAVFRQAGLAAPIFEVRLDDDPLRLTVTQRNPPAHGAPVLTRITEADLVDRLPDVGRTDQRFLVHRLLLSTSIPALEQLGWTVVTSLADCVTR